MTFRVALVFGLLAASSALRADFSDSEWKERPVAKVVNLLKDMQAELKEESEKDQELYDKLVCWCETNDKEKTKAIAIANQMIKDLTATAQENTAKNEKLTKDIETLNGEIAGNTNALNQATAVREKELAEFNQDEKDMISSLQSLKGAVTTLQKHNNGASFVQREALVELTHSLRRRLKQHPQLMAEAVAPHQRHLLISLLQQPEGMVSLLQQPVAADSYNSASGEIFGMLKQMKETFETNLEQGKKDEKEASTEYAELKGTKSSEIKAGQDMVSTKTEEAANAQNTAAEAKQDLKNTEAALAADTEFLAGLKRTCADVDKQWEMRSKTREQETMAVSDTIAFLTSDEANDQFSKSFSLLQVHAESQRSSAQREKARQFLEDAGNKLQSRRLSYLATRMRFDPFGAMRENIDGMVGALGKEKEDEIVQKDDCVDDFNTNDKQNTQKNEHKDDVEHEINFLEDDIDVKSDEYNTLRQEVADAQIEMKKAGENRQKENKEFQMVVSDQRATQAILKTAVDRLNEFYAKKAAAASLLQQRSRTMKQVPGAEVEAMPAGFEPYKKSSGGGAVGLIESIIADSQAVEKDAITAETDAQIAYEQFVKDTNKEIEAKHKAMNTDQEVVAKDKVEETEDEADKRGTIKDILKLGDVNKNLHMECDFTLNNFDVRQHAREDEMEALKQSKAIFSGMAGER